MPRRVVSESVVYDAEMLKALILYSRIEVDEKAAEQIADLMGMYLMYFSYLNSSSIAFTSIEHAVHMGTNSTTRR